MIISVNIVLTSIGRLNYIYFLFQVTTTGAITTAFLRFVNISTQEKGRYTCFKANGASTNTFTVFVDQSKSCEWV